MKKSFEEKLVALYKADKRLDLLQYAYGILFAAVTVVAGLIALINQAVGVAFLIVPLISLVAFCMNLVVWSVIKTAVEFFYPEVLKSSEKAPKSKKQNKKD